MKRFAGIAKRICTSFPTPITFLFIRRADPEPDSAAAPRHAAAAEEGTGTAGAAGVGAAESQEKDDIGGRRRQRIEWWRRVYDGVDELAPVREEEQQEEENELALQER